MRKTINTIFNEKENNHLSIYFTAGFPEKEHTTTIIKELAKSEVDFIEVGLPYSDPLADGETIQRSSQIAIDNGMNLDVVFDQLMELKNCDGLPPLVLMGYLNQILVYGEERFCKKAQECGIDTLIIPDLPLMEYENHYKTVFSNYGLSNVFLITPNTSEERIRKIDELTDRFIYMVSTSGITGAQKGISEEQIQYFEKVNNINLNNKVMIGFGISNFETYTAACKFANGAIVGSAFIKSLEKEGINAISTFVKNLKVSS